jgi:soluble lytic murein transglycosylase-like protein
MRSLRHRRFIAAASVIAAALLLLLPGEAFAPGAPERMACVPPQPEAAADAGEAAGAPDPGRRALANHISRRFAIAGEAAMRVVDAAYDAGDDAGLDPLLLLAVISVESRFNPFAQSALGAKGLMQIIPKYHHAEFAALGGDSAVLDPEANVLVGARILRHYVKVGGTLEDGLQIYAGAIWDGSAQYTQKVLAERERLEHALPPASRGRMNLALTDTQGS